MMRYLIAWLMAGIFGGGALWAEPAANSPALPPAAARKVDFVNDIKPLFEASCVQCHAKGKDKGGFSLETRQTLLKGGDSGAAVVAGNSADSEMVKLVAGIDPDSVMPKKGSRWTRDQVGLLRAWIDGGMPWDDSITFARPSPRNFIPKPIGLPQGPEFNPIDRILGVYFKSHEITPAKAVEDRLLARRVYLDTIGLLPTAGQLQAYLDDRSSAKRDELAATLLADKRGYADHWLTFWNDLLRNDYRGTGFIDGGRRQITGWLYAALADNKPYDQFVAELVNPTRASEGFSRGIIWRGAVNSSQLPPMQAAQNISQVFMGVNLKCASCHDSFVSDWTLADCYGLAAVYTDDTLELVLCDKPTGKVAAPRFLYTQMGGISPKAPKAQRLTELARLMTDRRDGRLPRTIVNRLWAKLFGRGLVEPLDDMEQPAFLPDLLDWLADDLVAHKYDLKHTIALILTSRAYAMPTVETPDGKNPYVFRGPQTRRLTAEQFCDALNSFGDTWPRMPATLQFDFSGGGMVSVKHADWIWTDEPVQDGQERAIEQWKKAAEEAAAKAKADARKREKKTKADESKPNAKPEAAGAPQKDIAPDDSKSDGKSDVKAARPSEPKTDEVKTQAEDTKPAVAVSKSDDKDKETELQKAKREPPRRHSVAFRSSFDLAGVPGEAYAVLGATQKSSLWVNGKEVKPMMAEGRVAMFDVKGILKRGVNVIVFDVASHTEKGNLNDLEKDKHPAALNHVNKTAAVAFYLRAKIGNQWSEIVTDPLWTTRRSPDGKWKEPAYDASEWTSVTLLAPGQIPLDEGPGLDPIIRKDFANEPVDVSLSFHTATTTASKPGNIRAALLTADPLMTALDRPNREQVMTSRSTAATTLQALALTNGSSLDSRFKAISAKLAPVAVKNPDAWVTEMYLHALGRKPTDAERQLSLDILGAPVKAEGVADFLWGLTLLPEFQFIN